MSGIGCEIPVIDINNVVPLLVSAEFLKIDALARKCESYIALNIAIIMKLELNLSCIRNKALKNIA
jgi:hypothetical protein